MAELDDEVRRFRERVKEEVEKTVKPYPLKQRDLEEALEFAFGKGCIEELSNLLKTQDQLCAKCGECCRRCSPIVLTISDLDRIAKYLGLSRSKLKSQLRLKPSDHPGVFNMPGQPCPFLSENRCSIYPVRPQVCREFPAGYMISTFIEKQGLRLPTYCIIIREFFKIKTIARLIMLKLGRENPRLAGEIGMLVETWMLQHPHI